MPLRRARSLDLRAILAFVLLPVVSAAPQEDLRAQALAQREALGEVRKEHADARILWRDGHSGGIAGVDYSPDGVRVLTWGDDGAVLVWDSWLGVLFARLGLHSDSGIRARFSPDGEVVLVMDEPAQTASLWDGHSGNQLFSLAEVDELVNAAAFLSDGDVVTCDRAGVMRIWETASGRLLQSAESGLDVRFLQSRTAEGGAFLQSEREGCLLTIDTSSVARIVDPRSGETVRELSVPNTRTLSVGMFGDGRAATMEEDGATRVWPADGGPPVVFPGEPGKRLLDGFLMSHRSSPSRAITWSGSGLRLWDVDAIAPIHVLIAPDGGFRQESVGAEICVASGGVGGRSVLAWRLRDGEQVGRVETGSTPTDVALLSDGRLLLAHWCGALILSEGRPVVAMVSHASAVRSLSTGNDGRALTGLDGTIAVHFARGLWQGRSADPEWHSARFWDRTTGALSRALRRGGAVCFGAVFLSDGRTMIGTNGGAFDFGSSSGTLHAVGRLGISPDESRLVTWNHSGGNNDAVATLWSIDGEWRRGLLIPLARAGMDQREQLTPVFHPVDGSLLAAAHDDRSVRIWDGFDAAPVAILEGHDDNVRYLTFDATGELLLSAGLDGTARLWDMARFEERRVLEGHHDGVWHGAFRPGGRELATASLDGTARIWDVGTGGLLHVLAAHTRPVRWVGYHPDGELLLTCSDDGTARLWDAETGEPVAVLSGHLAPVPEAVFTDGGTRILTRGDDATVRVWECPSGRLLLTRVEYAEQGWLSFTPGGYFIAGGKAADWAQIRDGRDTYPLSSYAVTHQSAEKVAASLAGEDVGSPPLLPAPRLTLAVDRNGEVSERRVHVLGNIESAHGIRALEVTVGGRLEDGSEVEPIQLADEDVRQGLGKFGRRGGLIDLHVPFPEGYTEVVIHVRAESTRRIKSRVATLHRHYVPPTSDLYVLAIAVQDYDDDALDLSYAKDDATALVNELEKQRGHLFEEVHTRVLLDREVTYANLADALESHLYHAEEDDTIVVFVAGHGARSKRDRFYLLTSDATSERPTAGISRDKLHELVEWEGIRSTKRLLLLDTCHAGEDLKPGERGVGVGVDDVFEQAEVDASEGNGLYIVAASTESGTAREADGNGVFTSAVLEALRGEADTSYPQGTVDVRELVNYVEGRVQDLTGGDQRPTVPKGGGGVPFKLARFEH